MNAAERTQRFMQVKGLMAGGSKIVPACKAAGISRASYDRWVPRFEAAGREGLEDLPRSGRPPMIELSKDSKDYLRKTYLRSNLNHEAGSMTFAARYSAKNPDSPLTDAERDAILKVRSSKHLLPVDVRRACRASGAEVARYRGGAKAGQNDGIFTPGWLRMADDGSRRLVPGERQVWDDASINAGVWAPWARGGDKTSDKFGVRVSRFQLLACIDCATDMCVGYSYVMRASDGYGAADVCGALWRSWQLNGYAPVECVMEGGSWQAERTLDFLAAAGVRMISAKGRPNQKLVEGWFNRLWTVLSVMLPARGHVGRFRGEMVQGNSDWMRCRAGRADPRDFFPSLTEFLTALDKAIAYLNSERVESRQYGNWVPGDVYGAQAVKGQELRPGLRRFGLPVRVKRKIGRGGMVKVREPDQFGYPQDFRFVADNMFRFIGAPVWVSFDPFDVSGGAIVELAGNWLDHKSGLIVSEAATCVSSLSELIRVGDGWIVREGDARGVARDIKRKSRALIGTQVAVHDERGVKARHAEHESAPGESEKQFTLGNVKPVVPEYLPDDFDVDATPDFSKQEELAGVS